MAGVNTTISVVSGLRHRLAVLALMLALISTPARAASPPEWAVGIDAAAERLDLKAAEQALEAARASHGSEAEWLWRQARHLLKVALARPEKDEVRKQKIAEALELSRRAIEIDDELAPAHAWYSYILGNQLIEKGPDEKLREAAVVRDHLERAIDLDLRDPDCYLALGRWHLEIASISWLERRVAGALFSEPPVGSFEKAEELIQKARSLAPQDLVHAYWLARAQLRLGKQKPAIKNLEAAVALPAHDAQERKVRDEAAALLEAQR